MALNVIVAKDYQELSQKVADLMIERIRQNPEIKLGLATGSTPVGMYRNLIEDHKKNGTSYKNVTSFNLDEYVGLPETHLQSYRYFMNDTLFDHIDINKENTYVPRGDVDDFEKECVDYENLIEKHDGIDLQVLGIGTNGHIGFNEPGTSFDSKTHTVELKPSTREDNARFFASIDEVPTRAITMGIDTIMKSKEILLVISGENKKEAVEKLLSGEVSEDFPASVLNNHPNVTVFVDEAAYPSANK